MEKEIQQLLKKVRKNHPFAPLDPMPQTYDFLIEEIRTLPTIKQKKLSAEILNQAREYSLRQPSENLNYLMTVFLLNILLKEKPKAKQKILKTFDEKIYILLKAYLISEQKLIGKVHSRDIFAHTIQTTIMVAEQKLGHRSLCASLLKHVPECSELTMEDLKKEFGDEIHEIITNVNRLKNISVTQGLKNMKVLRPMFLAISKELRSMIIKICSQVDWLRNLDQVPEANRRQIAVEAMQIYAPIADMLGMWELKWQLEDHAFKYLNPIQYSQIEKRFNVDEKKNRDKYIEKTKIVLTKKALQRGINCQISGRLKNFYSIHQKMHNKRKAFNEIYDVFALTVVVDTIDDCYRMLGIIHSLWKPKPRRVKDYIANPKINHYQSLHTTVFGLNNRMTEFQIRTMEMHDEANYGVAAHWIYKNQVQGKETPIWIKKLLQEQIKAKTEKQQLANLNTEILIDKIFVYTPKYDIIALPKGATPVDFAYQIHTDVGNRCQAAIVNGKPAALDITLKNEDVVEIIVDNKQAHPNKNWLKFVKSNLARKAIISGMEQGL